MKSCTGCKHALWDRTATGSLDPRGYGLCKYPYEVPVLPQAFYWISRDTPEPSGGYIDRRTDLKDHCTYYERKE